MALRTGCGGGDLYLKFFETLAECLSEAIRVSVRYDAQDDQGETRRARNKRFGAGSPDVIIPEHGQYLMDWFADLNRDRAGGMSGPEPITIRHIRDWSQMTGMIVRPEEVEIIRAMDVAFRVALAVESKERAALDRGT